jgi:hypothetical protein
MTETETGGAFPAWQPIATAPKDGTRFLAACPDGTIDFFHWQDARPHVGWRDSFIWVYPEGRADGPTHWLPLPPAPGKGGDSDV